MSTNWTPFRGTIGDPLHLKHQAAVAKTSLATLFDEKDDEFDQFLIDFEERLSQTGLREILDVAI